MYIVWATDIHLNFLNKPGREQFLRSIVQHDPDAVFITGDIAEAPTLHFHLQEMQEAIQKPIYFVLGNHDYYYGSIQDVRSAMRHLSESRQGLTYLDGSQVIQLTKNTGLVGQDGWGDGRLGNAEQTPVRLNDFRLIEELKILEYGQLLERLGKLGDESAASIRETLSEALGLYEHVVFLTHVPPFKEACWYQGQVGNDDWLPFFTCKAVGDVLSELMKERVDRQLTVLCGHTHHEGIAQILPNLRVCTGSADYGAPYVQDVLKID
ncbi:MAG: metallophosphoesterase family protein [Nitrospirales bacterium]|nr:metallophosphoesterase family protein [Nitrospira sp.]MDR4501011.1 metallophosphoesterase family protein [Nitrospirales bacterium]